MRIFVVEDHPDTLKYLSMYLEAMGHSVQSATTMREALAKLPQAACHVLISDIGLPDGDGWELLTKAGPSRPEVAIALSGYGTQADHAKSLQVGFQYHLTKPISPDALDGVLAAASEQLTLAGKKSN